MNLLQCDIIKKGAVSLLLLAFFAVQPLFAAPQKEARKVSPATEEKTDIKATESSGENFLSAAIVENKEDKEKENKESQNVESKSETEELPAANYSENDFMPKTSGASYAWDIFKLLLILALMVGGFYYFFRYISKKTGINVRGGEIMRTIAVVPVGQNKYIQVVDLAGKLLVIGVADSGINLITEITDKDDIDRIRLMGSFDGNSGRPSNFQDFLKERIGRGIGKVVGKIYERRPPVTKTYEYIDDSGEDIEYIKNQNGRLKKL